MNMSKHKLFNAFNILLLVACCVASAQAQEPPDRRPGRESRGPRRPAEEARRPQRPEPPQTYDRGAVEQAIAQPPNSVHVTVRYKKELGYKWEEGTVAGTGPTSCAAFSVLPDISIGRQGTLIPVNREDKMRDEDGYYYCDYLVSELPLDKQITISASLAEREGSTEAWRGGSQPQPPSGWQRVVDEGSRTVTLTTSEPRATMNFEMVYKAMPDVLRPRLDRNPLLRKP
jgi:hypothetical protein